MTQHELNIIDKHLKGINFRMIWALIVCTAVSVATVLSVYYGFKTDLALQRLEIRLLETRIETLENTLNNK